MSSSVTNRLMGTKLANTMNQVPQQYSRLRVKWELGLAYERASE